MFNTGHSIGVKTLSSGLTKIMSNVQSRPNASPGVRHKETAAGGGLLGGARNSTSIFAGSPMGQSLDTMLQGIIPVDNESSLRKLYKDIYYHDSIAGSAVDLMSTLPFSDFDLVGLSDDNLDKFNSSVERLNLKTLFPELSIEYLVHGMFVATLIYRASDKIFTDLIPHNPEQVKVTTLPMYGVDPLISVTNDKETRNFCSSTDPYIVRLRNKLGKHLIDALSADSFTLDPVTTLYLPRRTFVNGQGTSFYKRILPIYLFEKLMYRGTLIEATKRQRSILHVQAGDDNWEPTPDELNAIVGLFQQADLDPLGAIVATRQSIAPSDIRQGGDFWKWTDLDLTPAKLRALNISESFLSGDASYATAESNLSVFIENIKAYRENVTQKVFYNKLFPTTAVVHGLYKDGHKPDNPKISTQVLINDISKLLVPEVRWHKSLNPHNDRDTMETLATLEEKGIPVTLRMWAAAGNVDVNSLINGQIEDKLLREKLAALKSGGPIEPGDSSAVIEEEASIYRQLANIKSNPNNWINRDFNPEIVDRTVTGKRKFVHNQRGANAKANAAIAKALKNMSDPHYYEQLRRKVESRIKLYGEP